MSTPHEIVSSFLSEEGLKFSEENGEFSFGIRTENCKISFRIIINESQGFCLVLGTFPNFYKEQEYPTVYKVFNQYNMKTLYTKLSFDESDGEAYGASCATTSNNSFNIEVIRNCFISTVGVIDDVYQELDKLLHLPN